MSERLLSEDDIAALTIRGEADGEDAATKLAVAEVIRNRMIHHYASDGTVSGTVLAAGQFSCWWWKDPGLMRMMRMERDVNWDVAVVAWLQALQGSDTVNGALRYVNTDYQPQPAWATHDNFLVTVGKLSFYKG